MFRSLQITAAVLIFLALIVAISLPNFIGAQDRGRPRSTRQSYHHDPEIAPLSTAYDGYGPMNTEDYSKITDNPFLNTRQHPLSTFSIDVDTASYSNIRRFIEKEYTLPPVDAVRIEEMVNYFPYDYPEPVGAHPFSVTTSLTECPWNKKHQLLGIGLKSKSINLKNQKPSNLVFLVDVSGSMSDDNKLPLLKRSLKLLVDNLSASDHVSMVVYAGAAGLVLPPTSGDQKELILAAIDELSAGGSTAGAEGIQLAYQAAQAYFKPGGNNRVILATDGDFNVGVSSDAALTRLIETKRDAGIFLTVLGFGTGNYKDNKLEALADQGNGNYAYIDDLLEARKVLVQEMGSTLVTVAKDVKLQLEFNPVKVASYRLIGYENRLMAAEDFRNDQKDAGDMGAGATVTAFYELTPAESGPAKEAQSNPALKYQSSETSEFAKQSNEILTLKLRYKQPTSNKSVLLQKDVADKSTPWAELAGDFKFAVGVAGFGMLLRHSEYLNDWGYDEVIHTLTQNKGENADDYRNAFIALVKKARQL